MSQTETTVIPINPPNGTVPYIPPYQQVDYSWVLPVIVVSFIILYLIWDWMGKKGEIKHSDIMPTLDDLDSKGVSINRASLVQMLMVLPAFGALIWASMEYSRGGDPLTTGAIAFAVLGFQIGLIGEMRRRVREKYSGMQVMSGWMYTIDGTKRKYYWRDVEILNERLLPDEDYQSIAIATGNTWNKERLTGHKIYPFLIDNKGACYVITSAPKDVAFSWVKGKDYDDFGEFKIVETGPELHEVAKIHRITNDYAEEDGETFMQRDEYIRVFVTAWDDSRAVAYRGATQPVDITRDAIVGQLCTALGVQHNITAGMINTDRETLMNVLNDQRKLATMAGAIGSGMAAGIVEDKEALGTLDKIGLGVDWMQVIVYGAIFVFGVIFGAGILG